MDKILEFVSKNLTSIAAWSSIVGLILAVLIYSLTRKVKHRLTLYSDIMSFEQEREERANEVKKAREFIFDHKILDVNAVNRFLIHARYIQGYSRILSIFERYRVRSCVRVLEKFNPQSRSTETTNIGLRKENRKIFSKIAYLVSIYDKKRGELV